MRRALLGGWLLAAALPAAAEPYLAAREGFRCVQCHVNPTGGGMRNAFGSSYAQLRLAAQKLDTPGADVWAGLLDNLLTLGGDLRTGAEYTRIPHQSDRSAFETREFRLYLLADVVPRRLAVYLDQGLSPGSINREAHARLWLDESQHYYVKAGQMYLPYGLRLEDDTAFVREATGINMTTPDNGVEFGYEAAAWSAQLALSNGAAGGAETNQGKQGTARVEFVRARWRLGASASYNEAGGDARSMGGLFAGLRTGPLTWLAEADYIEDDALAPNPRQLWAGLVESNWTYRQGQNLKLTAEHLDPDRELDEDEQARYSLVWEYTPIQFLQLRAGLRVYDGIPQNDLQNRELSFLELHAFF